MEYPINENSQYPLIRKCVEKMFASRTKPMSEKTIEIWAEEIIMRNFSKEAIEKGTREFIENEDYNLSLPIVLKLISGKMLHKIQHDKNCPFCEGVGTVGTTLAFDLSGKLIDTAPYILNCYCNKKKNNLQMNYNKNTFHKTVTKSMYFRVFQNICEQDKYLQRVYENGDMDILQ